MYWVSKLLIKLKSNWKFMEFNKRKPLKINIKIKQEHKEQTIEIKEEIKRYLDKNVFISWSKKKEVKKIKKLKLWINFLLFHKILW